METAMTPAQSAAASRDATKFIRDFHGVRYQSRDVARAIEFYTGHLGFKLEHQHLPDFATVSFGELKIHLSGPQASGSRPLPGGRTQEPGGSNRVPIGTIHVR